MMSLRFTVCLCLVAALCFSMTGCSSDNNPGSGPTPDELEGTWAGSFIDDPALVFTYVFSGSTVRVLLETHQYYKGTFTLKTDVTPKQMDGFIYECLNPDYLEKTSLSIYELRNNNDSLIIAGNEPGVTVRPTSFEYTPGSGTAIILLKRQ
jgi:uncharacterized protein (TIGR03067 family)